MTTEQLDKLKVNDRVIVRIPAGSNSAAREAEATITRVGAKRLAVVVRTSDNRLRTLPVMNVLRFMDDQTVPEQKPVQGEEAVVAMLDSTEAKLQAEATKPAPAPKPAKAPTPTPAPAMAVNKEAANEQSTVAAAEVMAQAGTMSTESKEALDKLKPSKKEKTESKAKMTPEARAARKQRIKELLLSGMKNKEISVEVNCDPAYVSDVKKALIASGELAAKETPAQTQPAAPAEGTVLAATEVLPEVTITAQAGEIAATEASLTEEVGKEASGTGVKTKKEGE